MPKPNEPIWFNVDKTETANDDTYQTIKTNKVENKMVEINLGTSPHRIMVCTLVIVMSVCITVKLC